MKSKTFFILLVLCAVLAGVAWFVMKPGKPAPEAGGGRLLADLPVNDILRIEIEGSDGAVVLEKGEAVWGVKERFGYPADFPKLTDLVVKLRDMKIDRSFPADADTLDRLSLRAPGTASETPAAGTRIRLMGREDKALADILIGKTRESGGGRGGNFVMPEDSKTIYLVDQEFNLLKATPEEWIDKELLDISPDRVERVDRIDPQGKTPLYTVKRPGASLPPEMTDAPKGKKILAAKLNRLMDALSAFRIEDVIASDTPAEKTGIGEGPCFDYTLFDGTRYTVCLGKTVAGNPDRTYLKASVGFTPPPAPEKETPADTKKAPEETKAAEAGKTETKTDAAPEKTGDPAKDAAAQQERISPWIFAVPQWKADQFIADKADFFEAPESKKAED